MEQFRYHIWIQQRQVYRDHPLFLRDETDADWCNLSMTDTLYNDDNLVYSNYIVAKFSYYVKDSSVMGCDAVSNGKQLPTSQNSVASIFRV